MFAGLVSVLIQWASAEVTKEIINEATDKLLKEKGDGIDEKIVANFLEKAVESKFNNIQPQDVENVLNKLL